MFQQIASRCAVVCAGCFKITAVSNSTARDGIAKILAGLQHPCVAGLVTVHANISASRDGSFAGLTMAPASSLCSDVRIARPMAISQRWPVPKRSLRIGAGRFQQAPLCPYAMIALLRYYPAESEICPFIPRRKIPRMRLRVIGKRRLKQIVAATNEKR